MSIILLFEFNYKVIAFQYYIQPPHAMSFVVIYVYIDTGTSYIFNPIRQNVSLYYIKDVYKII